jgi:outer membrane receptor protein involved in Fe transport
MKKTIIIFLMTFIAQFTFGQVIIKGIITDSETEIGIPNSEILIKGTEIKTNSLPDGSFSINLSENKDITLIVNGSSYVQQEIKIKSKDLNKEIKISLELEASALNTVIVTGTRSMRNIYDVPQRVEVVKSEKLESMPSLTADNYLLSVPGVSVSRGASFFGTGDISIRGMGNEPGRTLIMIDGVPLNKNDGGGVNWNAINPMDIKQIEVLKGPGSSIFGGNAMGGVVNIITPEPKEKLQGYLAQSYGTFKTYHTQAGLSGTNGKLYWAANGMYRTSDGYITAFADEIDDYTVASFLDEYNIGVKVGYHLCKNQTIEVAGGYYSGKRGTGYDYTGYGFENDSLAADAGAYNTYTNMNARVKYQWNLKNESNFKLIVYSQRENYENIKESLRNDAITRYDVLSVRDDMGVLSSYNLKAGKFQKINIGIDVRYGAVDAADTYVTSTDNVINQGKMNLIGLYIQDEIKLGETPFSVLAALRFDYADFFDGRFIVENPTNQTSFLQDFSGELNDAQFSAFSPGVSFQYYLDKKFRAFAGYKKGYRTPVLDDMCRTGRISGGMKIANPDLKPEYLDNFEIGTDIIVQDKLIISPSGFYSIGTDFHAYISTGDSIFLSGKNRPIIKKENIGKVNIYGAEINLSYEIIKNLYFNAGASYIITDIIEYERLDPANEEDLTGKELINQPKDMFNLSVIWKNKIVNTAIYGVYKGEQWTNDVNTEYIRNYNYFDVQLWRQIYKGLHASVMVYNAFNNVFTDSHNMISPGRMFTFQLKYIF